ncbi:hypothetical protein AYO45_03830 [Gammaproteobacteria bacterium SCGC AG-212-F23]|nr:hypothetical protein AYO45_03830 [Gammaproteobacteria bacterium SCGC AG-212-F23]
MKHYQVLVTRPSPDGEALCESIRAAGGKAVFYPAIEIVPLLHAEVVVKADWVIFVSPQAVYNSKNLWVSHAAKVAAIGAGTAAALRKKGVDNVVFPEHEWNSEGLLQLSELQNVQGAKIVLIRGEMGREKLAETLLQRGALLEHIIAYRRILPKADIFPIQQLLEQQKIDIIVTTSKEGLQNMYRLLGENMKKTVLLVISKTMQDYAYALGFQKILLADNASNEAIIDRLRK